MQFGILVTHHRKKGDKMIYLYIALAVAVVLAIGFGVAYLNLRSEYIELLDENVRLQDKNGHYGTVVKKTAARLRAQPQQHLQNAAA